MGFEDKTASEREAAVKTFDWLVANLLTEKNTDVIIDVIKGHVPFGMGWVVGKVLDALMPETAVDILREVMQRIGWLDRSDRFMDSPLR